MTIFGWVFCVLEVVPNGTITKGGAKRQYPVCSSWLPLAVYIREVTGNPLLEGGVHTKYTGKWDGCGPNVGFYWDPECLARFDWYKKGEHMTDLGGVTDDPTPAPPEPTAGGGEAAGSIDTVMGDVEYEEPATVRERTVIPKTEGREEDVPEETPAAEPPTEALLAGDVVEKDEEMEDAASAAGGASSSDGGDEQTLTNFLQKQRSKINVALEKLVTWSSLGPVKESIVSAKARAINHRLDEIEKVMLGAEPEEDIPITPVGAASSASPAGGLALPVAAFPSASPASTGGPESPGSAGAPCVSRPHGRRELGPLQQSQLWSHGMRGGGAGRQPRADLACFRTLRAAVPRWFPNQGLGSRHQGVGGLG